MKLDSKYFDRIRTNKKRKGNTSSNKSSMCQWDNCKCIGEYRAPVGRSAENHFFLFCLEHVKRYNKGYNYFLELSNDEVGFYQKEAVTGGRFTWTDELYSKRHSSTYKENKFSYGNFADRGDSRISSMQFNALEILGLLSDSSPEDIRLRYKSLIKKHHPDFNGGDRGSEERFQAVIQAYRLLKQSGMC
ncbi:Molecular chaperone, DnaJ class [Candidatus Liberibacter americanus str. Sao Paulo]|uniref:Molecular chaperone, DnaJ class n=1 Tax=Candidatus Liberibacter americanus str. Sao Paulo TaxID=1261131 RepID=U6B8Z3_9HYPH|nr:J domain-containing protein [Candidatus Liberibacter americanus]AHA28331.1 Molecular chaperone, DnaJ class [Candidatus Liberibacter americanus str. Sao Paulo]